MTLKAGRSLLALWARIRPSRERWVELGVVIFGVFVALWSENAVQEWRWRREVAELDAQARVDMEENLTQAIERVALDPCLRARVSLLAEGLGGAAVRYDPKPQITRTRSSSGYGVPYAYLSPIRPWRTATMERLVAAEASKRVPRPRLIAYARALSTISSIGREQASENDALGTLTPLALGIDELTPEIRVTLLSSLGEVDNARANIELISRRLIERGADLRIAPDLAKVQQLLAEERETWGSCVDVDKGVQLARRLNAAAQDGE